MRPVDLARLLKVSPQALHRHLKTLVTTGILVAQGNPPITRYALAGIPDFRGAFSWMAARALKKSPTDTVCETRDILAARLSPFKALIKKGLRPDDLSLIISAVGEVGNNSFDHNLGQWRDVPGCWMEIQTTGNRLWICIADRGQGIYNSLSKVHSKIKTDQAAIETAFEKFISGRAPEKRGNGLKFVKSTIVGGESRGLACVSGRGHISFGDWGERCDQILKKALPQAKGTATLIAWRLKS